MLSQVTPKKDSTWAVGQPEPRVGVRSHRMCGHLGARWWDWGLLWDMPGEGNGGEFRGLKKSQAFWSSFGRSLSQKEIFYLGDCFPQAKLESGGRRIWMFPYQ